VRRTVGAVLVAGALVIGCSSNSPGSRPSTSLSRSPASVASYDAATPVGLAAGGGRVWTVEAGGDEITGRITPSSDPVRVHVGATPLRAAYDGRLLWVTVFGAGRVVAVDPEHARVVHRIRVPGQPEGIVAAFGAVWVVRQQARLLTRVTPTHVGPSYHLGDEPRLVNADGNHLFASNFGDGTITRVDPRSGGVKTSRRLCTGPQDLVVEFGVVWVTCTPDNVVLAVNSRTLKPIGKVAVAGEPDAIAIGSTVFVVTTSGPTLIELNEDAHKPAIVDRTPLGEAIPLGDRANVDAALVNGQWWVSSPGENRVVVYPK